MSNKVIRKFIKKEGTNFLRVNFVNEQLCKNMYFGDQNVAVLPYIFDIIKDGIQILDDEYKFLSYSGPKPQKYRYIK